MAITIWETAPLGSWASGAKLFHYEVGGASTAKDVYPTYDDAVAGTNALAQPVVLDSVGWAQVWLDGAYYLTLKDSTEATTYYTIDDFPGDHGTTDANTFPDDHISGLGLSNDTDADHDILVAAGEARDGADSEDMVLASPIAKQIDATWAVGDDAGGLDTGSVTTDTLYYVHLIKRTDTGVVDALFSLSRTSPTLPTNYDKKRLIGVVLTDGSSNIIGFLQFGSGRTRYFRFTGDIVSQVSDSTITDTAFEAATLDVPPSSLAHLYVNGANSSTTGTQTYVWVRTKDAAEAAVGTEAMSGIVTAGAFDAVAGNIIVMADSAAQVEYAMTESDGTATLTIGLIGFWMEV